MPLSPRPLHAAEHPRPGPDGTPPGFRAWSQHAGDAAPPTERAPSPRPPSPGIDRTHPPVHPLVKVAALAFVGYTFGRLVHRRSHEVAPPPPAQRPYRPGASEPYRIQPRRPRADIRFR